MTTEPECKLLKHIAAMAFLAVSTGPVLAGMLDDLDNATPAAAAMMFRKAPDWRTAPQAVKDRVGFMIFEKDFPNKSQMSIDDMTACLDQKAAAADANTSVQALINDCEGL